ncbi:MAG: nitrogen fixation protein [Alphaproteobacteria bacterium]|nr:nitrogen fixation protein [Alphaproteobacteria bacterium]MBV9370377.1 nitrogen fixation protein [Alphaproteobacteria bacterium]MBV9901966.1 nitrogen fixation protein [Alphaproteobacteria bacterium]
MAEARIFGIVAGTPEEPRVAYLKADASVTGEMVEALGPLQPTQVFRYAARCEESRCAHHDGTRCSLGARIAAMLPPVAATLPSCQIRPTCRWHAEIGGAACLRCPQVVTSVPEAQATLREVAAPRPHPAAG